jgi:IMP dehydrogenase
MGMWVGRGRKARVAYGFDDIALVPGTVTINPNEVDVAWELCGRRIELPIIAAAMDGVTDPRFAIEMGRLGGLAVLNLEGVQTRYENPDEVIEQIISSSAEEATRIIQSIYGEPIKEDLVHRRVSEIKKGGATVIVSAIPQRPCASPRSPRRRAPTSSSSSRPSHRAHIATEYEPLDFRRLKQELSIPLIVGNCVTYEATLELMQTGVDALLIGVGTGRGLHLARGPGSRRPADHRDRRLRGGPRLLLQAERALCPDHHGRRHVDRRGHLQGAGGGRGLGHDRVSLRARGGGAGRGYHWGMATPHSNLPRGTRIRWASSAPGADPVRPAFTDDGTMNLMGALRTCMGSVGAGTIRELQMTELIIAPAIKTEGKIFQKAQRVGMGK